MQVQFIMLLTLLSFSSVQSQNICNVTVAIHRELLLPGFHRNLTYTIMFENHSLRNKNKTSYFYDGCMLGVQQWLPAGIYVDADELEDLRRFKILSAYPHNRVNIEVGTPLAHPFHVYIFSPVKFNKVSTFLPVHARYHVANNLGSFETNEIYSPSIYLRCSDNRIEDCDMPIKTKTYLCHKDLQSEEKCIWKEIPATTHNSSVTWEVPVGQSNDYHMVMVGTGFIALFGCTIYSLGTHYHQMSYRFARH